MLFFSGRTRELVHGKAAAYCIGDKAYVRFNGRIRRFEVKGVKRNAVYIAGAWRPVSEVYPTARAANEESELE